MSAAVGKPTFAVRRFEGVCRILEEHDYQSSRLIPVLQAVQEEYRYLPAEVLTYVATALKLPPARVFGVASFYAHFALAPKGKYVIRLCDGTACHVKRSIPILDALRSRLGLTLRTRPPRTCSLPLKPSPVWAPAAWPR